MRGFKSSVAAVGVIGLMVVVGSAASAPAAKTAHGPPGPSTPTAGAQHNVEPATVVKNRKLKSSAMSTGFLGVTKPGGTFTAIDAVTTVTCPSTTTCTIEADQNVQALGSTANNSWGSARRWTATTWWSRTARPWATL